MTDLATGARGGGGVVVAPVEAPPARTLLDVFAATAVRFAERTALDAPGLSLSYAELAGAARVLSGRLRALGVGPGDRVGVHVASGTADLYVAILGVLGAGAAYVPVDADDPPARADAIWRRAGACAVVGDGLEAALICEPRGEPREPGPDDDAWVIFTSGSTGEPKGVAVSHRAAAAFVDAEARLFALDCTDRVAASLSVAFDASCEEIWLAWRNGAALVPAPRATVRAGAEFAPWLREHGITVVSTVPTLAAMWDEDCLEGVRLMILGGEACPQALAWRLGERREVWNTYGPTEATVVTTATPLHHGEPVTIGWPLAGWQVAVVDADGEPVPFGEPGELAIAGVGLGRYLDVDLDDERFAGIEALGLGWSRAYRTGDVVRETAGGLEFVGRRDDQVKLGGRRVELGEIDAQLRAVPGVRAAVAAVRESEADNKLLVGYVVGDVDPADVRAHVAEMLPDGIVPLVVRLDELPAAGSGKVDRRALPWPPPAGSLRAATAGSTAAELSGTAAWLAERWAEQLGPLPLGLDSDFFELGGSSLAAAKLVSALRRRYPTVAVADVYEHRRLGALAARLERLSAAAVAPVAPASRASRRGMLAQLAGVLVLLGAAAPAWLIGVFAYNDVFGAGPGVAWPALIVAWLALVSPPGRALLVVGARRLLLHDLAPGRYPRRGWLACRVWFVERLADEFHLDRLGGTPWAARIARLAGAEVGAGARLATLPSPVALIRIGEGATLEADIDAHGWWIEGAELVIGEVRVGPRARVGARTVLMGGADVGAGAEVEPGSLVSGLIPPGERWEGSPARPAGRAGSAWPASPPPALRPVSRARWVAASGLLSLLPALALLPGLALLATLGVAWSSPAGTARALAESAPLLAATFVLAEALTVALAIRIFSRCLRPGWYADEGPVACALWLCAQLKELSHTTLFPLYASVFTRGWMRLMGIAVGRRTEVSLADGLSRLVTLGERSFVADAPMFATARARGGWLRLDRIELGSRSFVGNGAVLPGGARVGDDSLVGLLSTAPHRSPDGTSWFGSPPLEFPRVPDCVDPARTTDPPRRLVFARGATELVRILFPGSVAVALAALELGALEAAGRAFGAIGMVVAAPLALAGGALVATTVTVAVKWLLIGRYRRSERPLWCSFVWRDEIVNSCQEQLAGTWLLRVALGTPVMSAYLRAMGAAVERDVWCETLAVTEYDLVDLRAGCAVNRGACLETHLVHDRLMRLGPATMHAGSTLGPTSATLPDTVIGERASVSGRSAVLRGEEIPPATRWHGVPLVSAS